MDEIRMRAYRYAGRGDSVPAFLVAHIQKLRWLGFDDEAERLIIHLHSDARCAALAPVPDTD